MDSFAGVDEIIHILSQMVLEYLQNDNKTN